MKDLFKMLDFLRPYKKSVFWGLLFVLICSLSALPLPLIYKTIMDKALPDKNIYLLLLCILGVVFLMLSAQIFAFFQTFSFAQVKEKVFTDLRSKIFEHLQGISLKQFAEQRTGGLLSRITSDVDASQFLLG